jgi:hypothetical protein
LATRNTFDTQRALLSPLDGTWVALDLAPARERLQHTSSGGELGGSELARVASRRGRAVVRRTGWFVARYGHCEDLEALRRAARLDLGEPALLDPAAGKRGRADRDWQVRVNTQVEPDL